jgi:hypothetical protein
MKVRIARSGFARWLRAAPPTARRWDDWRAIGGRWDIDGTTTLDALGDAPLAQRLAKADADLARFATNEQALRCLFINPGCDEGLYIAAYDATDEHFQAGILTWSENLVEIIAWLTLIPFIADCLEPGEYGTAVIHNYIWGGGDPDATLAALTLAPYGVSRLLPPQAWSKVVADFQPAVDAMLDGRLPDAYPIRVDLTLRGDQPGGSTAAAH